MRTLQTYQTTLATTLCFTSTLAVLGLLRTDLSGSHPGSLDLPVETTMGGADGEGEGGERPTLTGRLLVASPALADPYFTGTVIYMLADDVDGAIGVVLNRARDHEEQQDVVLWDGGPVGRERVFVLHDDLAAAGSVRVGDVAVAADPAILDELFSGQGPRNARVFVGYAGWGPGQLDREIAEGAWRTISAPPGLVLSRDPATITTRAYAQLAADSIIY